MKTPVEIISDLWIGSLLTGNNYNFQELNNISCLVSCTKDLNFLGKYKEFNVTIKNNMELYEIDKMFKYLIEVTEFINENLLNNKSVLIYCEDGIQKSPTIALAYLMRYGKMSYENSLKSIKSKKKNAFQHNVDFIYAINKFKKYINSNNI